LPSFQLNPAPFCLLDEVDAPLDDANTERYAKLVTAMSKETQFLFISHNKIAMEMAEQLIGVTMQEQGVSRIVAVDMESAAGMLAGVVAYNAWITRKSAPRTVREDDRPAATSPVTEPMLDRADEASAPGQEDGDRIEPVLDGPRRSSVGATPGSDETHDPVLSAVPDAPDTGRSWPQETAKTALAATPMTDAPRTPVQVTLQQVVHPPEKRPGLDALIDVIAPLLLEGVVSGEALLAAMPTTRRVGSKPFAVEGHQRGRTGWEAPRPGHRYRTLQAGVQLANRAGALNDIEFSEFVVKAQAYADAVGAAPDFPDMRAEVARARELDAFASAHDAQLGSPCARAEWPGVPAMWPSRRPATGFCGWALPGRMVLPGSQSGQAPMLSLSFDPQAAMADDPEQSALRELSLVAGGDPCAAQRAALCAHARWPPQRWRTAMDGVVTDDAGQPLSAETMDRIGADLETLYDALDSRDLSAGSAQARRLFS
jgi:hypothetical protein